MNKRPLLQLLLQCMIILSCFIAAPQIASADAIDKMADILGYVPDDILAANNLPTGTQLVGARDLINCVVAGGGDVKASADCVDKHGALLEGSTAGDTIVKVAELIIAIDETDIPKIIKGIGGLIGEEAPCIIAGIILPGVGGELCNLAKELIAMLGGLADAAEAVWGFFSDLFGGGDEPPSWEIVYSDHFVMYETKGLTECQDGSPGGCAAFIKAREDEASNHVDCSYPFEAHCLAWTNCPPTCNEKNWAATFTPESIVQASNTYKGKIYGNWTAKIMASVTGLEATRSKFPDQDPFKKLNIIEKLYDMARNDPSLGEPGLRKAEEGICASQIAYTGTVFNNSNWWYKDNGIIQHWKTEFPDKNMTDKVKSNDDWCKQDSWDLTKARLVPFAFNAMNNECPSAGGSTAHVCPTSLYMKHCNNILTNLGQLGGKDTCVYGVELPKLHAWSESGRIFLDWSQPPTHPDIAEVSLERLETGAGSFKTVMAWTAGKNTNSFQDNDADILKQTGKPFTYRLYGRSKDNYLATGKDVVVTAVGGPTKPPTITVGCSKAIDSYNQCQGNISISVNRPSPDKPALTEINILRRSSDETVFSPVLKGKWVSWKDPSFVFKHDGEAGKQYTYSVVGRDKYSLETPSSDPVLVMKTALRLAPRDLTAYQTIDKHHVQLKWYAGGAPVNGYMIVRNGKQIAKTGTPDKYLDNNLAYDYLDEVSGAATYSYSVAGYSGSKTESVEVKVEVKQSPQVATTGEATNVTGNDATLNGTITTYGLKNIDYWVEYGETTAYGNSDKVEHKTDSVADLMKVHGTIHKLNPGTTYHYRLATKTSQGPAYGDDKTFATLGQVVTTGDAKDITRDSATLTGTVTTYGAKTDCIFEFGKSAAGKTGYGSQTKGVPAGTDPMTCTANLPALDAATTYHYRLKTIAVGGGVGDDKTFTTASARNAGPGSAGELSKTKPLPDLSFVRQFTFGNITVTNLAAPIELDARNASQLSDGLCSFVVKWSVYNGGDAATGRFRSSWSNTSVPGTVDRQWDSIAAGSNSAQSDTLRLKPGRNILTISLDPTYEIKEKTIDNNRANMVVNLTGSCSPAQQQPAAIRTIPIAPTSPAAPAGRGIRQR